MWITENLILKIKKVKKAGKPYYWAIIIAAAYFFPAINLLYLEMTLWETDITHVIELELSFITHAKKLIMCIILYLKMKEKWDPHPDDR